MIVVKLLQWFEHKFKRFYVFFYISMQTRLEPKETRLAESSVGLFLAEMEIKTWLMTFRISVLNSYVATVIFCNIKNSFRLLSTYCSLLPNLVV